MFISFCPFLLLQCHEKQPICLERDFGCGHYKHMCLTFWLYELSWHFVPNFIELSVTHSCFADFSVFKIWYEINSEEFRSELLNFTNSLLLFWCKDIRGALECHACTMCVVVNKLMGYAEIFHFWCHYSDAQYIFRDSTVSLLSAGLKCLIHPIFSVTRCAHDFWLKAFQK